MNGGKLLWATLLNRSSLAHSKHKSQKVIENAYSTLAMLQDEKGTQRSFSAINLVNKVTATN